MTAGDTAVSDAMIPAEWIAELSEFIAIPSVSADERRHDDLRRAAEWVCRFLEEMGGTSGLVERNGRPLVVGEVPPSPTFAGPGTPSILLYGHFDVQPPGALDLWQSPPFSAEIRDGWLYGRGAADDKGNFYALLKAVALLARNGALPVRVQVLSDGEEEVLGTSVADHIFGLDAADGPDACIIFDGQMPQDGVPAFKLGTRGIGYLRVRVRTGAHELHSGFFGGAAQNAGYVLSDLVSSASRWVQSWPTGAAQPTAGELADWSDLPNGGEMLAAQGALPSEPAAADDFYVRTFARPAIDVHSLACGYPGQIKTSIPADAEATLSIRVAPGQISTDLVGALEEFLRRSAPPGAKLEIDTLALTPSGLLPRESRAIHLARDAFQGVMGRRPLSIRSGGTIPIVAALAARGVPTILTGFDVPEGNVHAPNERLRLENLRSAVDCAAGTLRALGELANGAAVGRA